MNAIHQRLYLERHCKKCKEYRSPRGLRAWNEITFICRSHVDKECCDVDLAVQANNAWWVDFPDSVVLCNKRKSNERNSTTSLSRSLL